jgi:hypothetical protein
VNEPMMFPPLMAGLSAPVVRLPEG